MSLFIYVKSIKEEFVMIVGDSIPYILNNIWTLLKHVLQEIAFVLWSHCQKLLDDPRSIGWYGTQCPCSVTHVGTKAKQKSTCV